MPAHTHRAGRADAVSARPAASAAIGLAATALGAAAYGVAETRLFTLRRRSLEITSSGAQGRLRILHLSDLHMLPWHRRKAQWVASLAATKPDLVVLTGDLWANEASLPLLLSALRPFAHIPGAFVFGSNDYYAPRPKNPFTYFFGPSSRDGMPAEPNELPWEGLRDSLTAWGWADLTNTRARLTAADLSLSFVGVDDPHLGRDQFPARVATDAEPAQLRIGLAHAPYSRVLTELADDGCELIFAGHTHGGQVCIPGHGALVTNCDLPPRLVAGLFSWPEAGVVTRYDGEAAGPGPWVSVSAGLGTSPFAPVRVACRPEAVLTDVVLQP